MKTLKYLSLALALASSARAADSLDPLLVTATRASIPLSQALSASTILTRSDIERVQAVDALELLRRVAGIDLARSGGPGAQTSLFMRGTNSNHVLVLIDGVRVASATSGGYSFEFLPVESIERIEIVRGPRASVWGSDAIGGVIQFFTRRDPGLNAGIALGSQSDRQARVAFGARGDRGGYRVGISSRHTDGISAQNANGFAFDPDNDGLERSGISLSGDYALSAAHRLDAFALANNANVEFDQGRSRTEQRTLGASATSEFSQTWSQEVQIGYVQDELTTPVFQSEFATKRTNAALKQTLQWGNQAILLGVDWQRETGRDLSAGSAVFDRSRRNLGLFAVWQGRFERQSLDLSARRDDSSQFGGASTGSIAWGVELAQDARLYVSAGQGFRAPNFNELYSPGFGGTFRGNPFLDPERSLSYEIGFKRAGLRISGFSNHIDDLIAFQGGQTFDAVNVREARIQGVELEYRFDHPALNGAVNATFQGPKDLSAKRNLLRRPEQKFSLSLDRPLGARLSIGADVFISGPRDDFAASLPGYGVLDLRARLTFNPTWAAQLRLANALDRDYELARGFNTEQRSVLLELKYTAN